MEQNEHSHSHTHNHSHGHAHGHHHHHHIDLKEVNRAFIIGIILNFTFVVIEVVVGLGIHSLSLLSDAGHNLADVASLALSLIAIRLVKVKSNEKFTYGYKKTTIIVALFNAAVLLLSIGAIGYEALHRLISQEHQALPGRTISVVAAIGIVINTVTALLFLRSKESDLNVKSAFMHLLSDAIVSAGLVIGGFIIFYTQLYWIDALLSIVIAVIILLSTWQLLKNSLRLSLDGVPEGIDLAEVKQKVASLKGVKDFHHIHIWAISTNENALTGHLVVDRNTDMAGIEQLKKTVKHELEHLQIRHATLEIEAEAQPCDLQHC